MSTMRGILPPAEVQLRSARGEQANASLAPERRERATPSEGGAHVTMRALRVSGAHRLGSVAIVEREVHCRVDEAIVRECLRKIAEERARVGLDLLGIQAHVVGEPDELVEELAGGALLAL